MGEYTPNIKLYKPSIGETEWGDLVNNNFDVLDEQIDGIKKELITMAIKILMNQAVAHAISKDFYSIIADVVTLDYPKGFKNTFESVSSPIEYEITIDNSNNPNDLTDYQILLEINDDEQFFEDCLYDQKLLEFYDEDKTTLLNHYVEEWDTDNYNAKIWIKVPNIPANSTKKIYLKINTERTEDLSDPDAVFDFFDDFEGDSLNTDVWEVEGSGGYSVTDSQLILWAKNDDKNEYARIKTQTFGDIAVKTKVKLVSYSGEDYRAFGIALRGKTTYNGDWRVGYHGFASDREDNIVIHLVTESATTDLASLSKTISKDTFYEMEFCASGNMLKFKCNGDVLTAEDSTYSDGYVSLFVNEGKAVFEYIIIRKYTEPEPSISYTRNVIPVDYVTVTFDFPEGVDKLLVTTDSDAQNVYYSTDDGNTWNPIEQDTETELPETAYSIKLKFEQATYMRGYAFLTW